MKRFAQQFKKQSEKTKLTAEEQFLLREKITTFMEYHPLPATQEVGNDTFSLPTPFITTRVPWKKVRMSFGLVAVAFFVTLPAVAEYTVPGDMLYPVKVRINEEVRSTLARTPYEKVEWESKRIERRISEARVLARAGLLTPEAEEAVAVAVTQHRSNANAEIALLRERNNTDEATLANMTLSSVFEVQSTAFQVDDESTSALAVATVVSDTPKSSSNRTLASVIEGGRAELALLNETEVISYERLMAEIERQTTRAYERLSSIRKTISAQDASDIDRRLNDISKRIFDVKIQSKKVSIEDISQLRQALQDTQKLIAFMNDIDVRSRVAVERIVPITLTFEERYAKFAPRLKEFTAQVEKIEQVLGQLPDNEKKRELVSSLNELKVYIGSAAIATPETLKAVEEKFVVMQGEVQLLTEIAIELGGVFDTEGEFGNEVNNGSTATTSTTSGTSTSVQ